MKTVRTLLALIVLALSFSYVPQAHAGVDNGINSGGGIENPDMIVQIEMPDQAIYGRRTVNVKAVIKNKTEDGVNFTAILSVGGTGWGGGIEGGSRTDSTEMMTSCSGSRCNFIWSGIVWQKNEATLNIPVTTGTQLGTFSDFATLTVSTDETGQPYTANHGLTLTEGTNQAFGKVTLADRRTAWSVGESKHMRFQVEGPVLGQFVGSPIQWQTTNCILSGLPTSIVSGTNVTYYYTARTVTLVSQENYNGMCFIRGTLQYNGESIRISGYFPMVLEDRPTK